jgi:hypothetical protein
MVFAVLGLVVVVVGWLSTMKWYIYPRRRDSWMGGKWYMGD